MKPPWEWTRETRLTVTDEGHRKLEVTAQRLSVHRSKVVDCLLRTIPEDEIIELVQAQLARDGAARATWDGTTP